MKLITFAIPCYNSQDYMNQAIESLLPGGEDVEIIIVNDGSSDGTADLAERYTEEYPSIIKVVHQENGGHGEAVNTGLKYASGYYFKVIDSDDWVQDAALQTALAKLRELPQGSLDLMVVNYVYERVSVGKRKSINYRSALPVDRMFTWDDIRSFRPHQYILMHSAIYRTQLLRDAGLMLPRHTFYVDNIFVYQPLPFVKNMYYLDIDFYRYFIGRDDQSVNEEVMMRRIDQQIRVTKEIVHSHNVMAIRNDKLRAYMINFVAMVMTVSSVLLIKIDTEESIEEKDQLWVGLEAKFPDLYHEVSKSVFGRILHIPGQPGKTVIKFTYETARKIFGFN